MEHVFLASGGTLTECDRVLYCASTDYLNVPFLEYVERTGLPRMNRSVYVPLREDANAFYQTFLFFCLLQEILGSYFRQEDYIQSEIRSDGSEVLVITTASLLDTFEKWSADTASAPDRPDRFDHLEACLKEAEFYYDADGWVDTTIMRSVQTTASAASVAIARAYDRESPALSSSEKTPRKEDLDIMVLAGWCPFTARRAWEACISAEGRMLLRTLRKHPPEWQDHSRCHSKCCLCATIDTQRFVSRHVSSDCECGRLISVDGEELATILQSGDLAVIEVNLDLNDQEIFRRVKLVGSKTVDEYITISHVWADGLANPLQNALPICQFLFLVMKVVSLKRKVAAVAPETPTGPEVIHFWLDVLCVPIGPAQLKSHGMQLMKETYRNASHCLVIDGTLERVATTGLNAIEVAAQIVSTTWIGRLWTLQEAILPSSLWFRFEDDYLSLRGILKDLVDVVSQSPMNFSAAGLDLFGIVRQLVILDDNADIDRKLLHITEAVTHRSVSVGSDEPLCLSTLIGENLPFVEDFEGQNMARFWEQCLRKDLVGTGIIFHDEVKLDVEGFRWAPKTLLAGDRPGVLKGAFLMARGFSATATLDKRGLRVSYSGLNMKPQVQSRSCHQLLCAADEDIDFRFVLVHDKRAEAWLTFSLKWPQAERDLHKSARESSELALILWESKLDDEESTSFGNVCGITDIDLSGIFVRTIGRCVVWKHTRRHTLILNKLLSDCSTKSVEEMVAELEELELFDFTLTRHGLTDDERKEDPLLLQRYAGMLLSRVTNGEYLEAKQHYDDDQAWIVD